MLLAAFVAQCLGSMRLKSATFDEPTYLAASWVAATTDADLNPAHPPLMKHLFAAALAFVGPSPAEDIPSWNESIEKPRSFGVSFLFRNRVDADTLLFAGRAAVVVLSTLVAVLVTVWARQLYGATGGLLALGLYAFCPNLIAHSTLATLDLGVTAGITAASYAFWRTYRWPTVGNGALAGVALGAAVLMKATALLLLGLLPLEIAAALAWHRSRGAATAAAAPRAARRRTPSTRPTAPPPTRALLITTAAVLLVALGVVAIAYGPGRFGLTAYVESFRHGFLNRGAYMNRNYETFCWGRYSNDGFRWYFLAAFLLKTPVPALVGTVAAAVWLARRGIADLFDELFLVLPIVAFFLATAFTRDDLGLRYVLPVYPLLYVLIGGAAAAALRTAAERARSDWRARVAPAAIGALALVHVGGALAVYPDYLPFFNGLFCGPGDGIRYLDDSNVDWGQDFKQLARYVHAHGLTDVRGLYHPYHLAPSVSEHYGLTLEQPTWADVRNPRPGWYAISAHLLQRPVVANDPDNGPLRFDWLTRFTPVAKIGYSIYLYHFE